MRVSFTVTGKSADEIEEKACDVLSQFTGIPASPADLHITVAPKLFTMGEETPALWGAEVEAEA